MRKVVGLNETVDSQMNFVKREFCFDSGERETIFIDLKTGNEVTPSLVTNTIESIDIDVFVLELSLNGYDGGKTKSLHIYRLKDTSLIKKELRGLALTGELELLSFSCYRKDTSDAPFYKLEEDSAYVEEMIEIFNHCRKNEGEINRKKLVKVKSSFENSTNKAENTNNNLDKQAMLNWLHETQDAMAHDNDTPTSSKTLSSLKDFQDKLIDKIQSGFFDVRKKK